MLISQGSSKPNQLATLLLVTLLTLLLPLCANAQKCVAPGAKKRQQIEGYVIARYRLSSPANVILTDSAQANDACYWMLKYETSNPKREITIYVSPDGNYLTPVLYDVRVDPLTEEAAERKQNLKELLTGTYPELGSKDASIQIVEFADFQCPYCKRMAETVRKEFLPEEANKVHFVFRQFPLPMHPWAMAAAEMAECVSLQKTEEFWKVYDFLFENQAQLNPGNLKEKVTEFVAQNVDVDKVQYKLCVDNGLATGPISRDVELGQKLGVRGTPTLFINGAVYSGFKDSTQLRALVEAVQKGDFHLAGVAASPGAEPVLANRSACTPPQTQAIR